MDEGILFALNGDIAFLDHLDGGHFLRQRFIPGNDDGSDRISPAGDPDRVAVSGLIQCRLECEKRKIGIIQPGKIIIPGGGNINNGSIHGERQNKQYRDQRNVFFHFYVVFFLFSLLKNIF